MSATTPAPRHPKHLASGGKIKRHHVAILAGGVVFALAWAIWTLWYAGALPK